MDDVTSSPYLAPYLAAARKFGGQFPSLLWASPVTQGRRFEAICRLADPSGQSLLDVGCGRADLLTFCVERNRRPADYVGIEAVPALAAAAEATAARVGDATIVRADFVADPARMFVAADVVAFSGSLNTLATSTFHEVLAKAYDATAHALVFNFLAGPGLAAASYLTWHRPTDVLSFVAARLSPTPASVRTLDDYLEGDVTVVVEKPDER